MLPLKNFPSVETDMSDLQRATEGHGADEMLPRILPQVHTEEVRNQTAEMSQVPERVRTQRLPQNIHRVIYFVIY